MCDTGCILKKSIYIYTQKTPPWFIIEKREDQTNKTSKVDKVPSSIIYIMEYLGEKKDCGDIAEKLL